MYYQSNKIETNRIKYAESTNEKQNKTKYSATKSQQDRFFAFKAERYDMISIKNRFFDQNRKLNVKLFSIMRI